MDVPRYPVDQHQLAHSPLIGAAGSIVFPVPTFVVGGRGCDSRLLHWRWQASQRADGNEYLTGSNDGEPRHCRPTQGFCQPPSPYLALAPLSHFPPPLECNQSLLSTSEHAVISTQMPHFCIYDVVPAAVIHLSHISRPLYPHFS